MFEVYFSNQALKFLRKGDPQVRRRVHELVALLKLKPVPSPEYDSIKLEGKDGRYRIRLSSYRVVYSVRWKEKEINLLKVERRDEHTY